MLLVRARWLLALGAAAAAVLWAQGGDHRRWGRYESEMQNPSGDPPDAWEKTEFAFARLRYQSARDRRGWGRVSRWGIDANKSERQFITGLRRFTRIHARSVEEIVDIESNELFNWPWIYAVGIGDWSVSHSQAIRLRQFFGRGGTLIVDDFHNQREWASFMAGMQEALPGCQAVELQDDDPILHTVYNLKDRSRVPGLNVVHGDQIECGGVTPHFRAILDGRGRVVVAICFNMDLGDAWEWADIPEYPEKYASMAYRIGVNYIIYALSHQLCLETAKSRYRTGTTPPAAVHPTERGRGGNRRDAPTRSADAFTPVCCARVLHHRLQHFGIGRQQVQNLPFAGAAYARAEQIFPIAFAVGFFVNTREPACEEARRAVRQVVQQPQAGRATLDRIPTVWRMVHDQRAAGTEQLPQQRQKRAALGGQEMMKRVAEDNIVEHAQFGGQRGGRRRLHETDGARLGAP